MQMYVHMYRDIIDLILIYKKKCNYYFLDGFMERIYKQEKVYTF